MSRFYVGQSVRIIAADAGTVAVQHIGKEAFINELFSESMSGIKGRIGVTIPGFAPQPWREDSDWCFDACQLEPLQPPKSQISEILAMKDLPNSDCKIARVGEVAA